MSIDKSQFVTPTQLAKMLGISRIAVHQKIKKGEIKAENIGDPSKPTYLIPKATLSEDLQNRISEQQKSVTKKVLDKNQHHDLSFEKELWMAADKLRGNVDVSEYKNIVLGLLFLKYISDSFYKQREVLTLKTKDPKNEDFYVPTEEARKSILETKDFYTAEGVFYVPEKSRWEFLQTKTMSPDLGKVLDTAMELIEKDNPVQLENVLPRVYTKVNLDHTVLGELVNIFSQISFDHDFDREKDILGRIYEYFLGQFASSEGKRGGEFFTPRSIVKLLVEILQPYENARVADFACGSGGMFVSMGEYLRDHKMDPSKLAISGQESNQTTLRLCKMNLAIRGLSGKIELGNTYYQDKFPHLQADFVIANPPFNAEWEPSKLSDNDPRIFLGMPPSGNANFLWVQHFAHHLSPNGQAGFVMPNGALAVSGKEGELRQKLVEADMVDVIISCPSKLFYNVSLPVSLWFLAKNKGGDRFRKRKGETLFIDAREIFEQISRKQVIFNKEQIAKITNTVRAWRGESGAGKYEDVSGFCKSVMTIDIKKKNYLLAPSQYVGLTKLNKKHISFSEDLKITTSFLEKETFNINVLDKKIADDLSVLYPEFNWDKIIFPSKDGLIDFAQKLFDEWFINFKFPGYEKMKMIDSELGKIPEGWKVKSVMDVIDRISVGKKYDNKSALPEGNIPILDQGASGFIGYHNEEAGVQASLDNPVVVFTNHTCYYRLLTEPFSCIQNVLPYVGKNGYSTLFVYFMTKEKIKMSEYKGHWPEFEQQMFIVPPVELADLFVTKIQNFIAKVDLLENENKNLKKMRDQLLAKLI
jgi:type I restriction enzyme M protein